MKEKLKNYFLSGAIVLVPIVITAFVVMFVVAKVGGVWGIVFRNIPYVKDFPIIVINIIGLTISVFLILFIGYLASNFLGRYLLQGFERLFYRAPLIKDIYFPAKEIMNTLFKKKSSFKRVVFVEFFHKGQYTIGFVTSDNIWKINGEDAYTIFLPTAPNPTGGFFCIVEKSRVVDTDMSVEDGIKIIVSSGMVYSKKGEINAKQD